MLKAIAVDEHGKAAYEIGVDIEDKITIQAKQFGLKPTKISKEELLITLRRLGVIDG